MSGKQLLNLEKICRICGARLMSDSRVSLFNTAESDDAVPIEIIHLLVTLQFNINKDDGLPQHICTCCLETLSAINEFYKSCERMQSFLWSLNHNVKITKEAEIKEDPLHVDSDESFQSVSVIDEIDSSCPYYTSDEINFTDAPISTPVSSLSPSNLYCEDLSQWKPDDVITKETPKSKKICEKIDKTTKKGIIKKIGAINECKFCKKKFANVINHQRKCHERNVEICKYCDMELANAKELNLHIDEMHPNKLPACSICFINFPTFKEKRLHRLSFHDRFQCEFCDRKFSLKGSMDIHKRRKHGEKIDKSCPICQKICTTQARYDYHMETHDPANLKYVCQFCEKRFHKKYHCEIHQLKHTGERPYLCEMCGVAFRCFRELANHRNAIHFGIRQRAKIYNNKTKADDKILKCPECGRGKGFNQRSLQKHLATCHPRNEFGEKVYPYTCPVCLQGFTGTNSLALHIKCHSENRPYQCQLCGSEFKRSQHLASHIRRLHTKEKNFTCEHCSKGFAEKFQLNEHIVIHSDERNFKCPNCPAAFKNKAGFRTHWRLHTGEKPYVCMICQKSFPRVGDLHIHHLKHTDLEREMMGQLIVEQMDANQSELSTTGEILELSIDVIAN